MKDGWHSVYGWEVYVVDGKVMRGVSDDGNMTVWPYRLNHKYGGWDICIGISVSAFRAGVKRATIIMR